MAGWELAHEPVEITIEALAAIIYLGVMVTVVGLILWLYLLKVVPARIAASVQYLQPIIGSAAMRIFRCYACNHVVSEDR